MANVKEAQRILATMGLPKAQQGDVAAYTLLALADLGKTTPWNQAKRRSLKIHDILIFIKEKQGKTYAENSRETVRRQVLHQLEQARVVDRNPDEPGLSTNSPRTHYAMRPAAHQAFVAGIARSCAQLLMALICSSIVCESGTVAVSIFAMSSSLTLRPRLKASTAAA